jgi:signal transduction histidine kinase
VRLTLWYLAIIALLFLIFSGVIAGTLTNEAYTQEEAALASAANQIAATYDPASCSIAVNGLGQGGVQLAKPLPGKPTVIDNATLLGQDGIVVIFDINRQPCKQVPDGTPQVYGPLTAEGVADLGQRVFGKQPYLDLPATLNAMALEVRTSPTGDVAVASYGVYATRVGEAASSGRILVVGRPFNPYQPVQQLVPALLIGGPLTLLIAAAGGYWLATRAMRPVRLITRTAREIGERDLDRRLNLNSHDELGELARTFDGMLDRLQAAFARQRQFTADASHELRTPLTIVDLEVTRALGQPLASEEYERVLAVVQSENAYMVRLVGDLLTLARADAGQNMLCMEALDLSDVALDVVERMAPLAQQAGQSLVASNLPELPVRGNRPSLAQALGNLVENAVKYTLGAGTRVELAAGRSAEDGREWAWVRVTDDGPGIAAEHLPHLCERFYRVDAARARHDADDVTGSGAPDGSGLGLAIVEWVARAHGGALRIRSAIGVGSVFELWLPLL